MSFFGARIISFLVLELGLYSLMIWGCVALTGLPIDTAMTTISIFGLSFGFTYEYLVKLINSVFVVIANYVMSKLMVFKKNDMVDYNSEDKASSSEDKANV
jgi:putative flippase GtrA